MTGELILVTGANGYIASRLIPRLLEKGYGVRALVRRPERLAGRAWLNQVEVLRGDAKEVTGLDTAMAGVHTAYYLIHSMASGRGYTRVELEAARLFAMAAERARVQHIIYLGGLADPKAKNLAPHMRSRMETGATLRLGRVPVTEFRAGVIAGPGSISFEMIRYLTECFPVLPGPSWLRNRAQPIAAVNVIDYLIAAMEHPEGRGGIHEMGGPEIMPYADVMRRYAQTRGLTRWLFTLPGIPIWLMARIVDWLTPVPYSIATPLVGGLQSDSIVLNAEAKHTYPGVRLIPYEEAVRESLQDLRPDRLEPVWEGLGRDRVIMKHEGFFVDYRRARVAAADEDVYRVLATVGTDGGWLHAKWPWRLRGWLSRFVGRDPAVLAGPRRKPVQARGRSEALASATRALQVGDAVEHYRVEQLEPGRMIRLHSELRAPGEGWIEWRIENSVFSQTSLFAPHGLPGFLYWSLLAPLQQRMFHRLIQALRKQSEKP